MITCFVCLYARNFLLKILVECIKKTSDSVATHVMLIHPGVLIASLACLLHLISMILGMVHIIMSFMLAQISVQMMCMKMDSKHGLIC